jgi:hypothetical protein
MERARKRRVALALAYAVVLGLWTYADQKSVDLSPGFDGDLVVLGFVALTVLVGIAVGRWWVLISLIGGLLPLIYLQETGYLGHGFDGADPIAPSSISALVWFGLFLLVGVGIRNVWGYLRPKLQRLVSS